MKLLNYEEAAEFLRCSPLTLRKKVMVGDVPHLKPFGRHGRVFFLQEDLEQLLLSSRQGGNTEN